MQTKPSFIELIQDICLRPRLYTLGGTYNEVAAFIAGYGAASDASINDRVFDRFVCVKNGFPTNYVWTYVIKECAKDDSEALTLMKDTIVEFVELKNTMLEEELMQFAANSWKPEESEAEKVFRKFDNALWKGEKEMIQAFILENENAHILWEGSYPDDVALKLKEIRVDQAIKMIPVSEDGSKVKIIAAGWPFAIEMSLINGQWRIDASDIIALRMSYK